MKRSLLLVACCVVSVSSFGATVKRLDAGGQKIVVRPQDLTVTIDVKDADARVILKSMQKQCGIKNLMIDPEVQGSGTFLFRSVPCRTAFGVVLRSLGLGAVTYANSVLAVDVPNAVPPSPMKCFAVAATVSSPVRRAP